MSISDTLSKIQTALKAPKDQYNNFGQYNYRSCESILEALKPHLAQFGATIICDDELVAIGDRYYVKATATLHDGTEHISAHAFAREDETKKGMDGSQITGAASSYARKYALNGLFAIDDNKDADVSLPAEQPTQAPAQPAQQKKTQPVQNNAESAPAPVQAAVAPPAGITENTPLKEASGWTLKQIYEYGGKDYVRQFYWTLTDPALKSYVKAYMADKA